MSKGDGSKIAIKFNRGLVGDVSGKEEITPYKFYKWIISNTWSGSRLYLYELEMYRDNGTRIDNSNIVATQRSSAYSSSYDVDRLFDGIVPGTEWDANGSLPHWVVVELNVPEPLGMFRWHTSTSSNKPKSYKLQGSNDGTVWIDIAEGESPKINNWVDISIYSGNEVAFKVEGQEYTHILGELVDKEYRVNSVERYKAPRAWEINNELELDVDVPAVVGVDDTVDTSTRSNSSYNNIANVVEFKRKATINGVKIKTGASGTYTINIKKDGNLVQQINESLPFETWVKLDITDLIVNNGDRYTIELLYPSSSRAYMVTGLYNGTLWKCVSGVFGGTSWDTYCNAMGFVEKEEPAKYHEERLYNAFVDVVGEHWIRWTSKTPEDTNVKIEVATQENNFSEVNSGDIINSSNGIWIRATLSTEDNTVTPVLEDLWLELVEEQDTILLNMKDYFRNAEGNLTIKYNQILGDLTGEYAEVETFEETFTPTDLEPHPNPWIREYVNCEVEAIVELKKIEKKETSIKEYVNCTVDVQIGFYLIENAPL